MHTHTLTHTHTHIYSQTHTYTYPSVWGICVLGSWGIIDENPIPIFALYIYYWPTMGKYIQFSFLMVDGLSKSGIKNTLKDFLYEMFNRPQNLVWRNTVNRKYMQFQIVKWSRIKLLKGKLILKKTSCMYILYFKQYVLYEILLELGKKKYTVTFKVVFYFRINFW